MSFLEIRLFGEPQFLWGGSSWRFNAPPKALPTLAYVALSDRPVPRATLSMALWPDDLESDARANLRRMLHRIAQALPKIDGTPWLITTADTIAWNGDAPASIDVLKFDALSEQHRAAEAVQLYQGDLLPSLYDDWIEAHRERRRERALTLLLSLAADSRAEREYERALSYATRVLEIDEWREDGIRELMMSRFALGDRSGALAAYERFANRLHRDIGAEPMPETKALRAAIVADVPLANVSPDAVHDALGDRDTTKLAFAGREREVETLERSWSRAAKGMGTTAFVCGEPGIGKTRIAMEIARTAQAQGGRAIFGRTSSGERVPYGAFIEALRASLPVLAACEIDDGALTSLIPLLPEILALRTDLSRAPELSADNMRARFQEAIVAVLSALAKTRPLLLVLEDLHWADTETIDMLGVLARRAGALPLMVVATARTHEMPAHLRDLRRDLQREHRATVLTLSPLDVDAVRALARPFFDDDHWAAGAASVYQMSEGNPLFAWQLLHRLRETGELPKELEAEFTIRDAVMSRVDALPAHVRSVAELASTIGREFDIDLLSQAGGLSEDAALSALGALMDAQLVRETGARALEYGFSHWVIASAIYDATDHRQRRARHLRIADLLDRRQDPRDASSRARHWELAGEAENAARAYIEAASSALRVYARDEAISASRQALSLTTESDLRVAALEILLQAEANYADVAVWQRDIECFEELAAGLGDRAIYRAKVHRERLCSQIGDRDAQETTLREMLEIAERLGDLELRLEALDARAVLEVGRGSFKDARLTLGDAIELAHDLGPSKILNNIRSHLIEVLVRSGEISAGRDQIEQLRAATSDSFEDRMQLLRIEGLLAINASDGPECLRIGREQLAIAQAVRDVVSEAKAYWFMGSGAQKAHDTAALQHYEKAVVLFERLRQPQSLAATYINMSVIYINFGCFEEADEQLQLAAAQAETCGSRNLIGYALANRAEVLCYLKRPDEARELAARALSIGEESGEQRVIVLARGILGRTLCDGGDHAAGLSHLRFAVDQWREIGDNYSLASELTLFIELLLDAREDAEARACALELRRLFESSPELQQKPEMTLAALAREARKSGEFELADAWIAQGKAIVEATLQRLPDDQWREQYRRLPYNAYLLQAVPA